MPNQKLTEAQWYDCHYLVSNKNENITFSLDVDDGQFNLSSHQVNTCGDHAAVARVVVLSEALNFEKLYQIQQELKAKSSVSGFRLLNSLSGWDVKVEFCLNKVSSQGVNRFLDYLAGRYHVEISIVYSSPKLTKPGLLLMDMDSTVIAMECIDEIAKLAGAGEQVSEVTELAMQGKLDFTQSLYSRVACLEGVDTDLLMGIRDRIPLMPGIQNLIGTLKRHDWKVAIASGGFTFFADYLKQRLGLDYAISNQLDVVDGKLTGKVNGAVIDGKAKAETLIRLADQYGIEREQTIAAGDGANDLLMMAESGLGVAYHAKPLVQEQADVAIRKRGLDILLDYLS